MIYTDCCCESSRLKIKSILGLDVITGISPDVWTLNDAMSIITLPSVELAVINFINEITVLEMAMLHFMCKPILITAMGIKNYPVLKEKIVDDIDLDSNLSQEDNTFIEWYIKYGHQDSIS